MLNRSAPTDIFFEVKSVSSFALPPWVCMPIGATVLCTVCFFPPVALFSRAIPFSHLASWNNLPYLDLEASSWAAGMSTFSALTDTGESMTSSACFLKYSNSSV